MLQYLTLILKNVGVGYGDHERKGVTAKVGWTPGGGLHPSKNYVTSKSREIPRHQDLLFSLLISLRQLPAVSLGLISRRVNATVVVMTIIHSSLLPQPTNCRLLTRTRSEYILLECREDA